MTSSGEEALKHDLLLKTGFKFDVQDDRNANALRVRLHGMEVFELPRKNLRGLLLNPECVPPHLHASSPTIVQRVRLLRAAHAGTEVRQCLHSLLREEGYTPTIPRERLPEQVAAEELDRQDLLLVGAIFGLDDLTVLRVLGRLEPEIF